MITATIRTRKKVKGVLTEERAIKKYHSLDQARKELTPIGRDMDVARKTNKDINDLPVAVVGVSWDTKSEKNLLLDTRVIVTSENEEE